jgi:hypothetical protein
MGNSMDNKNADAEPGSERGLVPAFQGVLLIYRRFCDNFIADIAAVLPLFCRCCPAVIHRCSDR